ncbi:MAG: hypothetical protein H6733_01125 [Alphaproteobacteria bacterium]|nr:hypothetical protein [Alphaproteobacteria bacterium]
MHSLYAARRVALPVLLGLAGCADDPTASFDGLPVDQAGPPLAMTSTDVRLNRTVDITVSGANANETITIGLSVNGTGAGDCPGYLGGSCFGILAPVQLLTTVTTNGAGSGAKSVNVPNYPSLNGRSVCFQAVARRPGPDVLATPVCVDIGYDTDGDGIINSKDLCPTGDDAFDWDEDGLADACDPTGAPPQFDTYAFPTSVTQTTFQTRNVLRIIPPNPVGIVWFFHGTGGDAGLVESPEGIHLLNAFLARGYGFVAIDSQNRSTGVFDATSAPASNQDWSRVNALRTNLINQGLFTANTPTFAIGFSAGSSFVSWLGHVAPGAGWPLEALAFHNHAGRSAQYGAAPDMPIAFLPAENDTTVDPATVVQRYDEHIHNGFTGILLTIEEERFAPSRLAVSPDIDPATSAAMRQATIDAGYYDAQGYRLFPDNQIDQAIDDIAALPGFTPFRPGKKGLTAMLATHVLHGQHAEEEADFFDLYR